MNKLFFEKIILLTATKTIFFNVILRLRRVLLFYIFPNYSYGRIPQNKEKWISFTSLDYNAPEPKINSIGKNFL